LEEKKIHWPHIVRLYSRLKNPLKYEQKHFARPNSSLPSPVPPALLLDDCWQDYHRALVDKLFSPASIIPPWFSMLIYNLGVTIDLLVAAVQRHLSPHRHNDDDHNHHHHHKHLSQYKLYLS
jgi:hypothetical protein